MTPRLTSGGARGQRSYRGGESRGKVPSFKKKLQTQFSNWLKIARFGEDEAKQIIAYHRTMPGYQATPLRTLEQVNRMIVF